MRVSSFRSMNVVLTGLLAGGAITAPLQVSAQEKAYFCNHANGSQNWQKSPCDAGMELRTGRVKEGGMIVEDSPSPPIHGGPEVTPLPVEQQSAVTEPEAPPKTDQEILHEGNMSILKLLGFGLIFGAVAKWLKRSFWGWFVFGVVLRFLLVAANVMSI